MAPCTGTSLEQGTQAAYPGQFNCCLQHPGLHSLGVGAFLLIDPLQVPSQRLQVRRRWLAGLLLRAGCASPCALASMPADWGGCPACLTVAAAAVAERHAAACPTTLSCPTRTPQLAPSPLLHLYSLLALCVLTWQRRLLAPMSQGGCTPLFWWKETQIITTGDQSVGPFSAAVAGGAICQVPQLAPWLQAFGASLGPFLRLAATE